MIKILLALFFSQICFALSGNQFVRTNTVFSGEAASNLTTQAPLSVSSTGTLTTGILNYTFSSSTSFSSTTTEAVITTMTTTTNPPAGTYLVVYCGNLTASSAAGNVITINIQVGGTDTTVGTRASMPQSSAALSVFQNTTICTNGIVTVTGSQAIAITGKTSAGNVTTGARELDIVRLQ